MAYGKRIVGLVTALIALAALALPVAADAGETDMAAGGIVEDEYVQTGMQNTPVQSSGETDAAAAEKPVPAPTRELVVYVDGRGETDRYASADDATGAVSGFRLTRSDTAGVQPVVRGGNEDRFVIVEAGETDRYSGMGTVEVQALSGAVYVLLREAVPSPDVA